MNIPAIYAFDAYGTLFDVHSAAARLEAVIGPRAGRLSEIWRDKQLQYTWVRALMDRHQDFEAVTEAALDYAIAMVGGLDAGVREQLLDAYLSLDAYGEVRAVLSDLKAAGARLAILSNGTPRMLDAAVRSSGLEGLFDAVLSIEQAGIYKPSPRVYRLVTDTFDIAPEAVSFQSSNRWDVAGASAFGFRTVWVNRTGQADEFPDLPADRIVEDLRPLLEMQRASNVA